MSTDKPSRICVSVLQVQVSFSKATGRGRGWGSHSEADTDPWDFLEVGSGSAAVAWKLQVRLPHLHVEGTAAGRPVLTSGTQHKGNAPHSHSHDPPVEEEL